MSGLVFVTLAVIAGGALVPASLHAQQEFTQQRMLVMNFETAERNLGRQIAHQLRSQVRRGSNRRELYVLETWEVDSALTRAGFGWDESMPFPVVRLLARERGTDELVEGSIERRDGEIVVSSRLVLVRDPLLVQPFPEVRGRNVGEVADRLAAEIVSARRQLAYVRRCENAAREQQLDQAATHAREGVRTVPRGTIIRTCLVRVLGHRGQPEQVVREGLELLRIDPTNGYGLEYVAEAYDQLRRRDEAAEMWRRLVALAPDSVELVQRVAVALLDGKSPQIAETVLLRAMETHSENASLMRLRWHAHFESDNLAAAVEIGERLLGTDPVMQDDSTFYVRMVGLYQRTTRPVAAVALAARGVDRFPTDPRLYLLYTELVRGEAPVALDRGLERFPGSAELLALRARELRREGRVDEALEATRLAVEADPRLAQGFLQLAQAYTDAGMHDSAYAMLPRAVSNGERPEMVAQYALSRGNALYREAGPASDDAKLTVALSYLALSDSLAPTREAKFLAGATGSILVRLKLEQANASRDCTSALKASQLLPLTMTRLMEGASLAPEAAAQQLEYLGRLHQVVDVQTDRFCTADEREAFVNGAPR